MTKTTAVHARYKSLHILWPSSAKYQPKIDKLVRTLPESPDGLFFVIPSRIGLFWDCWSEVSDRSAYLKQMMDVNI